MDVLFESNIPSFLLASELQVRRYTTQKGVKNLVIEKMENFFYWSGG